MGTGDTYGGGYYSDSPTLGERDASAGQDYSNTNIQVSGVDESDIVKTDGEFIYIASGSCVGISGDAQALSALEVYGIGEMTNCGYGDVYITGDVA